MSKSLVGFTRGQFARSTVIPELPKYRLNQLDMTVLDTASPVEMHVSLSAALHVCRLCFPGWCAWAFTRLAGMYTGFMLSSLVLVYFIQDTFDNRWQVFPGYQQENQSQLVDLMQCLQLTGGTSRSLLLVRPRYCYINPNIENVYPQWIPKGWRTWASMCIILCVSIHLYSLAVLLDRWYLVFSQCIMN